MNAQEKKIMDLEKRMYFFVPYNILDIQKGIQAGHGGFRYILKYGRYNPNHEIWDFIENHQTWIIFSGGTTNDDYNGITNGLCLQEIAGSLDYFNDFCDHNQIVDYSTFREPDLNKALTAVCFLADERVFNYDDYPDFHDWIIQQEIVIEDEKLNTFTNLKGKTAIELKELFPGMYPLWITFLGGAKNVFLRNLLKGKRFA